MTVNIKIIAAFIVVGIDICPKNIPVRKSPDIRVNINSPIINLSCVNVRKFASNILIVD
ncbi:hypothetical protein SDC9_186666 [bioreactor metagenome]|uniref:Uncharacterized protein n=1 Tax=bioreactor metagenome TaxID=1076179 RepID=A0A645HJE8_9ZZZZ